MHYTQTTSTTLHKKIKQTVFFILFSLITTLSLSVFAGSKEIKGKSHDFTLKSNKGTNIKLSDLKGKVVMINFWASWCGPCRQEMPLLNALYERYSPAGFELLGINIEPNPKDADKLLKKIPVNFPILYDTKQSVSEAYKVDAMPTTIMIDKNGKMRYIHRGYKPGYEKEYRKQVKALLRE